MPRHGAFSLRKRMLKMGILKLIGASKQLFELPTVSRTTLDTAFHSVQTREHPLRGYFSPALCPNIEAFINHFRDVQQFIKEAVNAAVEAKFERPVSVFTHTKSVSGVAWRVLGDVLLRIWYGTKLEEPPSNTEPLLFELVARDRDEDFFLFPSSLAGRNVGLDVRSLVYTTDQTALSNLFAYDGEKISVKEGRRRAKDDNNQYVMEIESLDGGEPKYAVDARILKWSKESPDGTVVLSKGRFLNLAVRRQAVHPQPQSFKEFWRTLPHGAKVLDDSERAHLQPTLQAIPALDGESIIIRSVIANNKFRPLWPYKIMLLQYNNTTRKSSRDRHEAYTLAVPKRAADTAPSANCEPIIKKLKLSSI